MGELDLAVLLHIITFLAFPFVGGFIATRFKLPPLLGYIAGGVGIGLVVDKTISGDFLSQFASLGLILLLFTVGLEINLETLKRFRQFTITGGILQIVLCAFFIMLFAFAFRFTIVESVLIGFSFAFSSTAVGAKIIQERGEENSLVGALSLGMLVFQDLAAIPLIIILSGYSPDKTGLSLAVDLVGGVARAVLVLGLLLVIGNKLVPIIFKKTAAVSRELLNLFTILFIFSVVALFSYLGLSASIAAFLAGILVGQTLEHYHIFSQIRPLRDIFTILFFVYLGASVNLTTVIAKFPLILLFTLLVLCIKCILIFLIFVRYKFHSRTAFSIGLMLCQVGEFAFILLSQAFFMKLMTEEAYYFAVGSVLMTIAATPVLIKNMDKIYFKGKHIIRRKFPDVNAYLDAHVDKDSPHIDAINIKHHVIICGYGRVGSYIGRALDMAQIPYIAIDYNVSIVEKARKENIQIIYGDPTDIDILDYAQAEYASCLISAVPDSFSQEMIILNAKKLNQKIVIFSRVNQERHQERLKDLGAQAIIQPEFEASLAIIRKIFAAFNVPKEDVVGKIKRLRIEHGMG